MKNKNILTSSILWGYIGVVLFLILYDFSDQNMTDIPTTILGIPLDKIAHFMMFFSFAIIIYIYRKYHPKIKWLQRSIVLLILGVAFAITTELLQLTLTSYRSFDILDIIADICGVMTGIALIKVRLLVLRVTSK